MSTPEVPDDVARQARDRVDEMPAESATGKRDPQGGGEGEPADYRNVQNDDDPET